MCLAIPGKVVSIETGSGELDRRGKVDFGGVKKEVNLALTPEASEGDYVLVHVGVALHTVDEEEARRIFDDLKRLGDLAELENASP